MLIPFAHGRGLEGVYNTLFGFRCRRLGEFVWKLRSRNLKNLIPDGIDPTLTVLVNFTVAD
jgi:hypothetical protein